MVKVVDVFQCTYLRAERCIGETTWHFSEFRALSLYPYDV